MQYLVNMISSGGKSKTITIDAESCKEATEAARRKYSSFEIGRVSPSKGEINYFNEMKSINRGRK